VEHLELAALDAGLVEIRRSPKNGGRVELIVRRPAEGEREVLEEAVLDPVEGLVGDRWRKSRSPDPRTQVTLANARVAALLAVSPERRPLAGDQLYVDLDLSAENLPPGTRLAVGSAALEVSEVPHTGCAKFMARFGKDALSWVSTKEGRALNLRGINARVVTGGVVRVGDAIMKSQT
jgi:hypothetical protein